jgi:hypothetical protein
MVMKTTEVNREDQGNMTNASEYVDAEDVL